jgi:hypothetical protein
VNIIVPNVSWGLIGYEADLLVMTKSRFLYEIEIKVSKSDLIRDGKKKHNHNDPKISKLFFAVPSKLYNSIFGGDNFLDCLYFPSHAGILVVDSVGWVKEKRVSSNHYNYKLTDSEAFQLARLGTMRIWTLTDKLLNGRR